MLCSEFVELTLISVLASICREILPVNDADGIGDIVEFHCLEDKEEFRIGNLELVCFDIHSAKEKQFGFQAVLPDGQKLCCLGDEPYCEQNAVYAENSDWLMCEAFCLYADRERFQPYEKHHSTVLDAARVAEKLNIGNLVLYHTEDKSLGTRRERYTIEAKSVFKGNIVVPDDLERILL